ncbi:MAG: alpha/beta hydrolase [Gammaproteobacteria bacterium]
MKVLLYGIATIAILYALTGLGIYFFQGRLIYFPVKGLAWTPKESGMDFTEARFEADDGHTGLHGWFFGAEQSTAPVLLFNHGNGGNISHRLDSVALYREMGFRVFLYDYRGYGLSPGTPNEQGLYADGLGAFDYLTRERGIPEHRIFVLGRSLGGAIATYVAAHRPVKGLIIENSFTSLVELGASIYPWLPVRTLSRHRYPSIERLRDSDVPVLIFHSPDDEIVPFEHGQALARAAGDRARFVTLTGGHNTAVHESVTTYRGALASFIAELTADPVGEAVPDITPLPPVRADTQ